MPQILEETLLVYVESGANSNKFYRLRLHDDGTVHKLWGRVRQGDELTGQQQTVTGGRSVFDKTIYDKTRKGYTKVDVVEATKTVSRSNVELHATAAASLGGGSTDPVVNTLIDRLVAANKHNLMQSTGGLISVDTSGQARTALGVISEHAVSKARDLLDRMVAATDAREKARLTEQYLRLVPHAIPVQAGAGWAETWLGSMTTAQAQYGLLDALGASARYADNARQHAAAAEVGGVDEDFFRYRVVRLDETSDEFQAVVDRFHATKKAMHTDVAQMTLKYVYRLEDRRHGDDVAQTHERVRNVQRLWHGTGAANVLSILQKGLFVPPRRGANVRIAGRMWGDGIYLSRDSTKSLRYSAGSWGGDTANCPSTFMFLTKTAMGYEYRPTARPGVNTFVRPRTDENGKPYDSTNVLPATAGVINHEAVVEDPMQVALTWLVEF